VRVDGPYRSRLTRLFLSLSVLFLVPSSPRPRDDEVMSEGRGGRSTLSRAYKTLALLPRLSLSRLYSFPHHRRSRSLISLPSLIPVPLQLAAWCPPLPDPDRISSQLEPVSSPLPTYFYLLLPTFLSPNSLPQTHIPKLTSPNSLSQTPSPQTPFPQLLNDASALRSQPRLPPLRPRSRLFARQTRPNRRRRLLWSPRCRRQRRQLGLWRPLCPFSTPHPRLCRRRIDFRWLRVIGYSCSFLCRSCLHPDHELREQLRPSPRLRSVRPVARQRLPIPTAAEREPWVLVRELFPSHPVPSLLLFHLSSL
jgi:hypothetical protein